MTAPDPTTKDTPPTINRTAIDARLVELRSEFDAGNKMLQEMALKQDELKTTLLRISGAIQVLEEVLKPLTEQAEKP